MKTSKILTGAALGVALIAMVAYWADSRLPAPGSQQAGVGQAGAVNPVAAAPAEPASAPVPNPPEASPPPDIAAPAEDEQQQLVARSMELFAEAVNKQDLGALQASGSSAFRNPENLKQLERNVQAYIDQGIDLSRLAKVRPEIETSFVEGRWQLAGVYRVESARIAFSFAYEQEAGEWRVAAMRVDLP